jgi:hypothetical protein
MWQPSGRLTWGIFEGDCRDYLIAEMIDANADTPRAPIGTRARLELPVTRDSVASAIRASMSWARPFAERSGDVQVFGDGVNGQVATMLRPIATPLNLGGFSPDVAEMLGASFRDYGFLPVAGAAAGGQSAAVTDGPLRPGSAIGVNIVSGDFNMGATGTVTEVIGNKVYAFGHPFFNLGPIAFPMTTAYVHTLLPNVTSSMKIATLGDVVGTVRQDRATTIAGLTGDAPATIPVKISLESERGFQKQFEFRVVNDQLFTPLFTYASILSTLTSYERETGAATFNIKGTMNVKSHGAIRIEDLFSGTSASLNTAGSVMAPLTFLLDNDFEPIQIESIDLSIQSTNSLAPRRSSAWLDGVRARRPHGAVEGADADIPRRRDRANRAARYRRTRADRSRDGVRRRPARTVGAAKCGSRPTAQHAAADARVEHHP